MRSWHHWKFTLTIRSPYLFGGLEPGPDGFDTSASRTSEGLAMIPGDHVRGHARHSLRAFLGLEAQTIDQLFGSASTARTDGIVSQQDMPNHGRLLFSDMIEVSDKKESPRPFEFPRIQVDDELGVVKPGMLQVIELTAPPGKAVTFQGIISYLEGNLPTKDVEFLLENCFRAVPAMGGLKSSGFGEVVHPLPELEPFDPATNAVIKMNKLFVSFDRPLLVNTKHAAWNAFESSTIVPGSAIKAAVGRVIGSDEKLNRALSKVVISHAFPVFGGDQEADLPTPLALAFSGDRYGLVLDDQSLVELCDDEVPIFEPDWKSDHKQKARELFKRPSSRLTFQSRGHVAISEAGTAEDGQLFVTRHVETNERRWVLSIERNGADLDQYRTILKALANGLAGIGRTGAIMSVVDQADSWPAPVPILGAQTLLILETPALLTSVLNHADSATKQYEEYFQKLLGERSIIEFKAIAQRHLVGDYLAHRFRPYSKSRYVPFELTNPGAIFSFTCVTSEAVSRLTQALRIGLPPIIGAELLENAEKDWQICPFMNHSGFGRISNVSHWLSELSPESPL